MGMFLIGEAVTPAVDLTPFITSLTSSITPASILIVLGSIVAGSMGLVLMWLGVKKAIAMFQSVISRGRIKV